MQLALLVQERPPFIPRCFSTCQLGSDENISLTSLLFPFSTSNSILHPLQPGSTTTFLHSLDIFKLMSENHTPEPPQSDLGITSNPSHSDQSQRCTELNKDFSYKLSRVQTSLVYVSQHYKPFGEIPAFRAVQAVDKNDVASLQTATAKSRAAAIARLDLASKTILIAGLRMHREVLETNDDHLADTFWHWAALARSLDNLMDHYHTIDAFAEQASDTIRDKPHFGQELTTKCNEFVSDTCMDTLRSTTRRLNNQRNTQLCSMLSSARRICYQELFARPFQGYDLAGESNLIHSINYLGQM